MNNKGEAKSSSLFNLSKKRKNRGAPLDSGLIGYFAYKTEEARLDRDLTMQIIEGDQSTDDKEVSASKIQSKPAHLDFKRVAKQYMVEKKFEKDNMFLLRSDYAKIKWLNVVPELICDVLCYMCNYFHYRTNKLSREAYENMLSGQKQNTPVMSEKQL